MDGIGGWDGVGEVGVVGDERRHIPEAHQGLKCLCHGFWARQAMPGLSQAFRSKISPSRRGSVNMSKIIYFHSVWPNLNQDRRKLEGAVSMS